MILGAHISVAGGVEKAPGRGKEVGAEAIQIFTANQRQWTVKAISDQRKLLFQAAMSRTGLTTCLAHASYLINLCSPEPDKHQKSMHALRDELFRAEKLKISHVIIHPGAHRGKGELWAIERIASSINSIYEARPGYKACLLLETTSGQGTVIGHRFEHLHDIMALIDHQDRVSVCLDTAHIFAAGYDIRTRQQYQQVMAEFDDVIGLDKLVAIHLNDSRGACASRLDRHMNIGQGHLGLEPFTFLVNDARFRTIPGILETPVSHLTDYAKELQLLRSLQSVNR
ncbi:deoxyribonuclease IV [candidate division CSSED10-310 bacterium]|uniref:Probable endonuclease 4 n=1 Tax=candidate division CSSED10-310 bacterium TaxID=2855610 RepID=A0ABV6YRQ7_UNCC1